MMLLRKEKDDVERACEDVVSMLLERGLVSANELNSYRKMVCERYGLKNMPGNPEILSRLPTDMRAIFASILRSKPVRTASGIAVIALMTKPYPCPHGSCLYCPGGVQRGTPQSYTGSEPAAMRAAENDYDPYKQVNSRLKQLTSAGHRVGKAEIIIIGGSFLNLPPTYQYEFIKSCYDALNGGSSSTLREAQNAAESASIRNVGFTLETRPDLCKEKHIDLMLSYGITRVEIGVQALDDQILQLVNRGHSVTDVVEAFQKAKDSGLKIVAHMMPGLPGSNPEKDLGAFRQLLEGPLLKPDMLKIYPCLVVESTSLHEMFQKGLYQPYDESVVIPLLADVKRLIPRWLRIMRIQREIPSHMIVAGTRSSNLRELVLKEVERRGYSCRCIRCREVGLKQRTGISVEPEDIRLFREDYEASGGVEVFLSFEDMGSNVLVGFLRLRVPSGNAHRPETARGRVCIVRELHVYGPLVPVGSRDKNSWQHKGFGAKLMKEAEQISKHEFDAKRILVTSSIGTRAYYRRLGYQLEGPYMAKEL